MDRGGDTTGAIGKGRRLEDLATALDFLSGIAEEDSEARAVERMLDLFETLCSPERIAYVPFSDGAPGSAVTRPASASSDDARLRRTAATESAEAATVTDTGFVVRIARGENLLGVLAVDGIASPQLEEECLDLARDVVGVLSLAISNARGLDSLTAERDTLAAMMENTPEAHLALLDSDLRFILVNSAYAAGGGHPKEELIGRYHFDLFPSEENEAIFRKARDSGERVEFKAKPFVFSDQPWRGVTYWDWSLTPLPGPDGRTRALAFSLVDVTEAVRRQQLADALGRLDVLIHSTLDFRAVMQRLVVDAAEAAGCESVGFALKYGDTWRTDYVNPRLQESAQGRVFQPEEIPVAELALARRASVVIDDVSTDPGVATALEPFGVKSILNVPLFIRGDAVGVIGFHYHTEPVGFSRPVIEFAERLATSTSFALSNAKLYEEEHHIAESLRDALTHPVPRIAGVETGVVYRPAFETERVGGDFYDVFEPAEGLVAVLVGDVSGKGVKAAGLTETVRSSVRAFALVDPSPALVLERANAALLGQLEPDLFVTCAFVLIDRTNGEARAALAGHPSPAVCGRRARFADVPPGLLLGAFDTDYQEAAFDLADKTLVLYTDGVTEARRERLMFGQGQLLRSLRSSPSCDPQALADLLLDDIIAFGRGRLADDVVVLALRVLASARA